MEIFAAWRQGVCGDWGKAAGRHDSQAEGQQLEGGREIWTSNTDWEKMNEEKTKVLQDTLVRWGTITAHACGGIKHKAMLIKVTKHPRLHARTKRTELPKVSKVSKVPIYTIRNIPAQPNPNIHARPQHAFPSNLKSLNYIPTNNLLRSLF